MTGGPLRVEPVKMGFERTLAASKDVRAPAAQHVTNEGAAMSGATHDLLNGGAALSQCENGGVGLLTAYVAFILDTLGGSDQARMMVVAPIAARISRMDFRTASRKARLAFSMRCHRSATGRRLAGP
jgi:hypothetical protein